MYRFTFKEYGRFGWFHLKPCLEEKKKYQVIDKLSTKIEAVFFSGSESLELSR